MADVTLLAAVAAGTLSFLSPCVLPLVPPYLTYLAGAAAGRLDHEQAGAGVVARGTLAAALLFVLGFSTVFVLLGAAASQLGAVLRFHSGTLSTVAGVLIILMGLHFMGAFRVGALMREMRFDIPRPSGLVGAYGMGLAFAFGWTPCIGPVLAAILAVAGAEATLERGMLLLAAYSAGLGVPFLLAAALIGRSATWMAAVKRRMAVIEKVTGGLLVATGIAFLTGWMSTFSFYLLENFPFLARLG